MLKKARLLSVMGLILMVHSISCFVVFCVTYKEKKSLASAFWALCLAFGAAGTALLAIYSAREEQRLKQLRKRIAEQDHWFHSFEYPDCAEPGVDIDEFFVPPVETEDESAEF